MMAKGDRFLLHVLILIVIIGLSTVLGNYAAIQMAEQAAAMNSLFCQILFIAGLVAGSALILGYQAWERNRAGHGGRET